MRRWMPNSEFEDYKSRRRAERLQPATRPAMICARCGAEVFSDPRHMYPMEVHWVFGEESGEYVKLHYGCGGKIEDREVSFSPKYKPY